MALLYETALSTFITHRRIMANIMQPITPNRTKTAPKKASALSGNMTPSYVVFDECFVALERVCSWQHTGSQNRQRSGDHAWLDVCSLSIRPSHGGGGRGRRERKVSVLHLSPFFASIFPLSPQKRLILRLRCLRFGVPKITRNTI